MIEKYLRIHQFFNETFHMYMNITILWIKKYVELYFKQLIYTRFYNFSWQSQTFWS